MRRASLAFFLALFVLTPSTASPLDAFLETCSSQNFPFIFLNVRVDENGVPRTDLTEENFQCLEDGVPQTDGFAVTPPEVGGGVRLADIVFLIDTSGSMGGEIAAVRANVSAFAQALGASDVDFRLGLVRFGNAFGANPFVFNSGNLTGDVSLFESFVASLGASGGFEPGFLGIRTAIQSFTFRPGSQRVFILISDEDSDDRNKQGTIDLLLANDVTVHAAVNCSSGASNPDYCDATSVRGHTGGLLFSVVGPYDAVLSTIAARTAATYVLRYRSSSPDADGTLTNVECTVSDTTSPDIVSCSYIPGAAPRIELTAQTEELNRTSIVEGSSPTIQALVRDDVSPGVQPGGVVLFVRSRPGGIPAPSYTPVVMSAVGGDLYEAVIPPGSVLHPSVDYFIRATDAQVTSSLPSVDAGENPIQIAVLPNEKPIIEHTPVTSAAANADIELSTRVTDSTNQVARVELHWRHLGQLSFNSIVMERTFGSAVDGVYDATISAVEVSDDIEYFIHAVDDLGVANAVTAQTGSAESPLVISLQTQVSNVLFFPGIYGSRLFQTGLVNDDEVWPPTGVLGSGLGLAEVCQDFHQLDDPVLTWTQEGAEGLLDVTAPYERAIEFFNGLAAGDEEAFRGFTWRAVPYDWRLLALVSAEDSGQRCDRTSDDGCQFFTSGLLDPELDPDLLFTGFDDLFNLGRLLRGRVVGIFPLEAIDTEEQLISGIVEDLAARTGKVSIVAHSTGGLLARRLIQKNIIPAGQVDKVIFVGTPLLGAPKALGATFHGANGPSDALSVLCDDARAREMARSFLSAYLLGPSGEYFRARQRTSFQPPVQFVEDTTSDIDPDNQLRVMAERAQDNPMDSLGALEAFIFEKPPYVTSEDERTYFHTTDAEEEDRILTFSSAELGAWDFAHFRQEDIQDWSAPSGLDAYSIVGTNYATPFAVAYQEGVLGALASSTTGGIVGPVLRGPRLLQWIHGFAGDGTVPEHSATDAASKRFFVDLAVWNDDSGNDNSHGSLLRITPVLRQIRSLLRGVETPVPDSSEAGRSFITAIPPALMDRGFIVTALSPVWVHLFDEAGRHTGPTNEGSGAIIWEEAVPNSDFEILGGHQTVTFVPRGGRNIIVEGRDEGTFSLILEEFGEDGPVRRVEYPNLPATRGSEARLTMIDAPLGEPVFTFDINADGETDFKLGPDPLTGDLDADGDVDRDDLALLLTARNQSVTAGDPRDIDKDRVVTSLDARRLVLLCSRPRCATK